MGALESVKIRLATADDAESLAWLHVDAWEDAYVKLLPPALFVRRRATIPERIQRWRAELAESPSRTSVAQHTNGPIWGTSLKSAPRRLWTAMLQAVSRKVRRLGVHIGSVAP